MKEELFQKLWRVLYSGEDSREEKSDPQVRRAISRMHDAVKLPEPDYDVMWGRVKKHIEKDVRRKFVMRRMGRAVAGIVLPLVLIGGAVVLLNREKPSVEVATSLESPKDAILLRLSDGREVNLRDSLQEVFLANDGVTISRDSSRGLMYRKGFAGDTVSRYNTIEIPLAADYRLQLSDGTVVYLNAASKLRYPVVFRGGERKVYLEGEGYFEVAKDAEHPFRVEVRGTEVTVLGTRFNINAYPEKKEVRTTLTEGRVRVTNGVEQVVLSPGEQASSSAQGIEVKKVDVREFVSWKDGLFIFNKMSLEDIMIQMERWYGLKIVFFDEEIKGYTFTGMVDKNLSVRETFKVIEKVVDVRFSEDHGNVVITKLNKNR